MKYCINDSVLLRLSKKKLIRVGTVVKVVMNYASFRQRGAVLLSLQPPTGAGDSETQQIELKLAYNV